MASKTGRLQPTGYILRLVTLHIRVVGEITNTKTIEIHVDPIVLIVQACKFTFYMRSLSSPDDIHSAFIVPSQKLINEQ